MRRHIAPPPKSAPLPLTSQAFGLRRGKVKLIQTHIGWVYVMGKYAFKLKKHVKFDFLDFTTLKGRRWACEREIELNRRLCPDLYLGLCPVLQNRANRTRLVQMAVPTTPGANYKVPRSERLIDWAVWMRRMPESRMLNRLLDADVVSIRDVARIADTLSNFYLRQRRPNGGKKSGGGELKSIRFNINENLREGNSLDRALLSAGALRLIGTRARKFLREHIGVIKARVRDGFVVDGHGDLRAENICLPQKGPPLLFDCIEFNDRFRICDTALDAAFLAMDLDSHGRHDLSRAFLRRYEERCDRALPPKLLNFYLGYRAFVKAKVAAWIAADGSIRTEQRSAAEIQSRQLFDLAVRYALQRQRVLLVFCGVSGSGKSSLASHVAARLNCTHLATDILRDEIVPRGTPAEKRYAPAVSGRVYELLYKRAAALLSLDTLSGPAAARGVPSPVVILDGTFLSAAGRKRAAQIARRADACSVLVWADSPRAAIESHFKQRKTSRQFFGSEAALEISLKQQAQFETPSSREGFGALCRIDTSQSLSASAAETWNRVLEALAAILP